MSDISQAKWSVIAEKKKRLWDCGDSMTKKRQKIKSVENSIISSEYYLMFMAVCAAKFGVALLRSGLLRIFLEYAEGIVARAAVYCQRGHETHAKECRAGLPPYRIRAMKRLCLILPRGCVRIGDGYKRDAVQRSNWLCRNHGGILSSRNRRHVSL